MSLLRYYAALARGQVRVLPVQRLHFSYGWIDVPALQNVQTIRMQFRFPFEFGRDSRAEFLLDFDNANNSYSVSRDASYGEFSGTEGNFVKVWKDGVALDTPNTASPWPGKIAFTPFEDGEWHILTLQTDQPLSFPYAQLLTKFANSSAVYNMTCDVGRIEFYDRVQAGSEIASAEASSGALAVYRGRLSGSQLLDESGNNRHAWTSGSPPQLI